MQERNYQKTDSEPFKLCYIVYFFIPHHCRPLLMNRYESLRCWRRLRPALLLLPKESVEEEERALYC